ncbi:M1 family metallopeptidase [Yinghuangia soli]|uniref:Aminopeptidase N n=1 Tax=Yinghuangia soli TaxID=2908204 RepID=A0AA41Q4X0_9ACTN|nr:M1 family metallopeptidase [Yinghuangia soli]MCF2531277.1 M1 family metallopeptidase [Yinghuangia soli]
MNPRPRWLGAALAAALALSACTSSGDGSGGGKATGGGDPASTAPGAGAAGAGDPLFPLLGNGGYDVGSYDLSLAWDPAGNRLAGTAEIIATATQQLTAFNLDFHGLEVRVATVDGVPAARIERKGDELTLTPAQPLAAGQQFAVAITYRGTPQTIVDPDGSSEGWMPMGGDGAVALGEPAGSQGWFPGNHTPADKALFSITLTVPQGLTAVSNGRFMSRTSTDGRDTFRWQGNAPMATYLAVAAIGRFRVEESTAAGGLPAYYAFAPGQESEATRALPELVDRVLSWAGAKFEPYPFDAAGAIVGDLPSLGYALETQTRPFFEAAPPEETVVHELAHQWFGNSVGPRTWQDMWLNEGFATYAEWLWREDHGGPSAQESFTEMYDTSGPAGEGIWAFPPASPRTAADVSGAPVYGRGAMVLHKVREAVGDAVFAEILRTWLRDHRHGTAATADFVALCERLGGKDLSAVFGPWLFEDGKPPKA